MSEHRSQNQEQQAALMVERVKQEAQNNNLQQYLHNLNQDDQKTLRVAFTTPAELVVILNDLRSSGKSAEQLINHLGQEFINELFINHESTYNPKSTSLSGDTLGVSGLSEDLSSNTTIRKAFLTALMHKHAQQGTLEEYLNRLNIDDKKITVEVIVDVIDKAATEGAKSNIIRQYEVCLPAILQVLENPQARTTPTILEMLKDPKTLTNAEKALKYIELYVKDLQTKDREEEYRVFNTQVDRSKNLEIWFNQVDLTKWTDTNSREKFLNIVVQQINSQRLAFLDVDGFISRNKLTETESKILLNALPQSSPLPLPLLGERLKNVEKDIQFAPNSSQANPKADGIGELPLLKKQPKKTKEDPKGRRQPDRDGIGGLPSISTAKSTNSTTNTNDSTRKGYRRLA